MKKIVVLVIFTLFSYNLFSQGFLLVAKYTGVIGVNYSFLGEYHNNKINNFSFFLGHSSKKDNILFGIAFERYTANPFLYTYSYQMPNSWNGMPYTKIDTISGLNIYSLYFGYIFRTGHRLRFEPAINYGIGETKDGSEIILHGCFKPQIGFLFSMINSNKFDIALNCKYTPILFNKLPNWVHTFDLGLRFTINKKFLDRI